MNQNTAYRNQSSTIIKSVAPAKTYAFAGFSSDFSFAAEIRNGQVIESMKRRKIFLNRIKSCRLSLGV